MAPAALRPASHCSPTPVRVAVPDAVQERVAVTVEDPEGDAPEERDCVGEVVRVYEGVVVPVGDEVRERVPEIVAVPDLEGVTVFVSDEVREGVPEVETVRDLVVELVRDLVREQDGATVRPEDVHAAGHGQGRQVLADDAPTAAL